MPPRLCGFLLFTVLVGVESQRQYDMDRLSTCGQSVPVDDSGVRLRMQADVSSANAPLECVVYLRSIYSRDDGTNKLEITVEHITLRDGGFRLDVFDGRRSAGQPLRSLGGDHGSTDLIYSDSNEVTIKLTRPRFVYQTENEFSIFVLPWKDREATGTTSNVSTLSVGAIIGIILGCLVLIALIILFCWCCCTGRLGNFDIVQRYREKSFMKSSEVDSKKASGVENKGVMAERGKPGSNYLQDSTMWKTNPAGNYNASQSHIYQKNQPRFGRRFDNNRNQESESYYKNDAQRGNSYRKPEDEYEGYNFGQNSNDRAGRNDRSSGGKNHKETLIDDVFDSDSVQDNSSEDTTLQTRPPKDGSDDKEKSPKSKRKSEIEVPEEKAMDKDSPQMQRFRSMDLQSQPDDETIASPLHVNAGVLASVEDEGGSPSGSLRKKKGNKSAQSKRKKGADKGPDPMAMPPEAFDPIFTAPLTGIDYPGNRPQYGVPAGYPGLVPYGLVPAFPPGPPGSQTYAYAYQTPGGIAGQPATQGAYFVQNTPTNDGNKRTAIAVEQTVSPKRGKTSTPESHRRKNSDPFRQNGSGSTKRGKGRDREQAPDMSIIARGAAPPDPGPGHRSVAMKSGTDPDSGVQTTQVVWTDTVPDPSDPKPGENPQITRKTITRVTTKSGHGELPPEDNPLLALDDEPAFLSPSNPKQSSGPLLPALPPATHTPESGNVAFYSGVGSTVAPPDRASTPTLTHQHPAYSSAIRDRITMDSTV